MFYCTQYSTATILLLTIFYYTHIILLMIIFHSKKCFPAHNIKLLTIFFCRKYFTECQNGLFDLLQFDENTIVLRFHWQLLHIAVVVVLFLLFKMLSLRLLPLFVTLVYRYGAQL